MSLVIGFLGGALLGYFFNAQIQKWLDYVKGWFI